MKINVIHVDFFLNNNLFYEQIFGHLKPPAFNWLFTELLNDSSCSVMHRIRYLTIHEHDRRCYIVHHFCSDLIWRKKGKHWLSPVPTTLVNSKRLRTRFSTHCLLLRAISWRMKQQFRFWIPPKFFLMILPRNKRYVFGGPISIDIWAQLVEFSVEM